MTHRSRRTVLAAGGASLLGMAAGCLDETDTQGAEPDDDSSDADDDEPTDPDDDGPTTIEEAPRVDEPPHEIDRPELPDDPDEDEEWNDDYLGEHMATEPSLEFEVLEGVRLADSALDGGIEVSSDGGSDGLDEPDEDDGSDGLDEPDEDDGSDGLEEDNGGDDLEEPTEDDPVGHGDGDEAFFVRLLEHEADLEDAIDLEATDDTDADALEAVDFAETAVVIVESGWGSSSVHHRWVRVEDDDDAVHLHGYYTDPHFGTTDYTTRHSVVTVDRPANLEFARASVTVSEDRRIHVNSTEGVVSLADDD